MRKSVVLSFRVFVCVASATVFGFPSQAGVRMGMPVPHFVLNSSLGRGDHGPDAQSFVGRRPIQHERNRRWFGAPVFGAAVPAANAPAPPPVAPMAPPAVAFQPPPPPAYEPPHEIVTWVPPAKIIEFRRPTRRWAQRSAILIYRPHI